MSDTGKLIDQVQDAAIWGGIEQFSRLPEWLAAARNPAKVSQALEQTVPEFQRGEMVLHSLDTGHIRYKNDTWSGLYELEISRAGETGIEQVVLQGYITHPDGNAHRFAAVHGAFGAHDWRADFPQLNLELRKQEDETVLDALDLLTDPEKSRHFLMDSIRRDTPAYRDMQIEKLTPKIVRYKPGSRCTIVYHLEYADGHQNWPDLVVAKTYRGVKGQNAYDGMLALWQSPLGSSNLVTVAEPLAYDPEQRVLVQGPIREETTLKVLYRDAVQSGSPGAMQEAEGFLAKTAAGLAELHRSGVTYGRKWLWADELNEVRERIDRLSSAIPGLKQAATPLLERLVQIEAATPPDPLVPTHGSFRPAQVLLHQGSIGFIDFDSVCQSEPANDLALFLSTIKSLGMTKADFDDFDDMNEPLDAATRRERFRLVMEISSRFLDEYEKIMPVSRQRVALWETLDIMMLVLHGWIKIKVGELADIWYLLEQFLVANQIAGPR